jgi:uncharacterized XkdX family phage protein
MAHSEKYEKVKHYFVLGLWSVARVRNAVIKGWITETEFTEITGEEWQ